MVCDKLKTVPLLFEDDLKDIFGSAWRALEWCSPRKTKKNPDGLRTVEHLMYHLDNAVSGHLAKAARKAIRER